MSDLNNSFLNVLVVVILGAFFATSASVVDSWKHMDGTKVVPSPTPQQEITVN